MPSLKLPRLKEDSCGLLVIDLQEKFAPHIQNWKSVVEISARLINFFQLIKAPILITEQYPKGLGATVPEIRNAFTNQPPIFEEKTMFSSCGTPELMGNVKKSGRTQWVLCGIENHICVQQTAFDLLEAGCEVFLAMDGVGSRHALDHQVALDRMFKSGAVLSTSESLIFEVLRDAKHPMFRQASSLVK